LGVVMIASALKSLLALISLITVNPLMHQFDSLGSNIFQSSLT